MNLFTLTQPLRDRRWFGFVFGFFAVLVAFGIRIALGEEALKFPFVIFIPFVVLTTFLGGVLPGIAAAVLAGIIADLTLIAPPGSIWPTWPDGWSAMFFYILTISIDIALIQGMITAYRRAEVAERDLRLLNEELKQTVDVRAREHDRVWINSRDLLVVIGADGVFRAVSPAWTDVLGHTPQEVVGKSFLEFIHPADAALTQGGLNSAVAGNDLTNFENRYWHKDGSSRLISWHTSVEGDLVYAYGRDITATKNAETKLAHAQLGDTRAVPFPTGRPRKLITKRSSASCRGRWERGEILSPPFFSFSTVSTHCGLRTGAVHTRDAGRHTGDDPEYAESEPSFRQRNIDRACPASD